MKLIEEIASGLSGALLILSWSHTPIFAPYYLLICALLGCWFSLYYTPVSSWKRGLKTAGIAIAAGCVAGFAIWGVLPWAAYGICALLAFFINYTQLKKHASA